MKKFVTAAIAGLCGATLFGSSALASSPAPNSKNALLIGEVLFPSDLNPFTALDFSPTYNWALNYDLTVPPNPADMEASQGLIDNVSQTDDGKKTVYRLSPGLRWSDGTAVTARDLKWTYENLAPSPLFSFDYTNITSVKVINNLTLEITTSKPAPILTEAQYLLTLPAHVWEKVPPKELNTSYQPAIPMVGTGPYIVSSFKPNSEIEMDRNTHFRGPKPSFAKVDFIKYGDLNGLATALTSHAVDMLYGTGARSIPFKFSSPIKTGRGVSSNWAQLSFNACRPTICPDAQRNPAVLDPKVRLAIAYALNLGQITKIATQGEGYDTDGQGFIGPFYKRWDNPVTPAYRFEPARAEQMLDEAGWRMGPEGVRERAGVKLSLRLLTVSDQPAFVDAAQLIADQAKSVGIRFKIQSVISSNEGTVITKQVHGKFAPDFDALLYEGGGDAADPSISLATFETAGLGAFNSSLWTDPEYDRLYEEQLVETDLAARQRLVTRMESIVQQQAPAITLWYEPSLTAWNSDAVTNLHPAYPANGGIVTEWGYAPLLAARPGSSSTGGEGGVFVIVLVVVALASVALIVVGRRRRPERRLEE